MSRKKFSGNPKFEYIGNCRVKLLEDFTYYPDKKYGYKPVTAKKGFISDLMSVPWFVRPIIHKYDDTIFAAIPHDVIFEYQDRSLKEANHIFLLAMQDANTLSHLKIPLWKRTLAYNGVRVGGWILWKKQMKKLNNKAK